MFTGLSLFSSAGIAELNLKDHINFVLANEIIPIRAKVHKFWHPNAEMICGDITDNMIKEEIVSKSISKGVNFVLATPPCQGVSLMGKNKRNEQFLQDKRNFLIFHALDVIDRIDPDVIVIENVDRFLRMQFPNEGIFLNINELLATRYNGKYNVQSKIYNAADYGVPQARKRCIIIMSKSCIRFDEPEKVEKHITVRDSIGNLPSLEAGETSTIKNHNARMHPYNHILCMKHTPTGRSAFQNQIYYPKRKDGVRITGYPYTYKRIEWDKPAPTITMRSDTISSTHSVHPGRYIADGIYSDARVLTLRELFILSSIDPDIDIPDFASECQIRGFVGEAVPPMLMESICKNIRKNI